MKTLPAFKLRSNKQTKKKNQPTLTTQEKKETLSKKREAASTTIQSQIQSYAETLRQHIDQPNVYTDEVSVKHDPNTPPKKPRKVTKADLRRQERLMRGQMKELEPYLYPYSTERENKDGYVKEEKIKYYQTNKINPATEDRSIFQKDRTPSSSTIKRKTKYLMIS